MKSFVVSLLILLDSLDSYSQNTYSVFVKDSNTKQAIAGAAATLSLLNITSISDAAGIIRIENIPDGRYTIKISHVGYRTYHDSLTVPSPDKLPYEIFLKEITEDLEQVVITSTRSSRTIENIPTRVEFIAGEELEEKGNMKPGDIRMMLSESTGIQTQQTSATSANSSIRIQGLDGRYTQILKDGFPLYSGAASGLGLLQTPPLDLKQVEIVKGSASTLYGGGAIAGLVNLISKTPLDSRELRFYINATSASGLDVSGFYGYRINKTIGLTLFGSRNGNAAFDPAGIDLTAIPKFERYTFNPKLFVYLNDKTKIDAGINTSFENRVGGDIHYIQGNDNPSHTYFERNKTRRLSTQFSLQHKFDDKRQLNLRSSYSNFDRVISTPGYTFSGLQNSTFTEANYSVNGESSEWVLGINIVSDQFNELAITSSALRDYNQITSGAFIQNTLKASQWLDIETGIRTDIIKDYGTVLLPRLSVLVKLGPKLSSRLGGGLGYKTPTIFTEEGERIQYNGVAPISTTLNKLERSFGTNLDVNYKTLLWDNISIHINHLFFYTYLNHPLTLKPMTVNTYQFQNISGHIDTKGTETNLKLGLEDFKLFLGYTYTDAVVHSGSTKNQNLLTPKHRINSVLMYEEEDKWKIGLEAYYFGRQKLSTGTGRQYWTTGFMAEKLWERFSLYINFENFTDTRQTKFESIYTGSINNPVFKDIYAPLDGFVVNGGIKIRL